MAQITPSDAEELAGLVAKAGRASADAKRAVKAADKRLDELEVRVVALEHQRGWAVSVLDAVKGLSAPAQATLAAAVLILSLAVAGVVFPNIPAAIAAIGGIHAPVSSAP